MKDPPTFENHILNEVLSSFQKFFLQELTIPSFFRNNSVTPINQLLATLRFFACGTHQDAIGDFMGMHQSTASRIIKKVSEVLASLRPLFIKMPTGNEIVQVQHEFHQTARFPGVLVAVDGTHNRIKSPGN